jgi:hypothetical protein
MKAPRVGIPTFSDGRHVFTGDYSRYLRSFIVWALGCRSKGAGSSTGREVVWTTELA